MGLELSKVVRGAASVLLIAGMWAADAQDLKPLSLDEALRIAEANAPAVMAAAQGAQAAREMAVAAGQLPDPVLRVGVDNLPVNGTDRFSLTDDFMTMRRIGVMQEYVSANKRKLQRRIGELAAVRQDAARHTLAANLRREVAAAWFDVHYTKRARELVKALESEVELQLRLLDSQIRAGKASVADVPMATAVLLQTQDRLRVIDRQEQVARIALARWLASEARRPTAAAPDVGSIPRDAASGHAASLAPSVREQALERDVAEAELALAEANRWPNWSWEVMYAQRGRAYSNMVSFGVNIPLTLDPANRQGREIAAKRAQVSQAHAMHEDTRRAVQAELSAAQTEWQSLMARRQALTEALLPVSRQRIDVALAAYRSGQGNLASVLEARRTEVEAQLQVLELEREAAGVWAQLQYVYADPAGAAEGARP